MSLPYPLSDYYRDLETRLPIESAPNYGSLVVATDNYEEPIHRWFRVKEAFSSRLLTQVLKDTGLDGTSGLRLLDPFAGSGTTQVSVADAVRRGELDHAHAYGIERNPFLHLVASTKLRASQDPPTNFSSFADRVCRHALSSRAVPTLPSLSTFHRTDYFDLADVHQLLRLRAAIDQIESDEGASVSLALARVCLGSIVEEVSNLRKDGRALRYHQKAARPAPIHAFRVRAAQIGEDLFAKSSSVRGRVLLGDGRRYEGIDGRYSAFDLVLFSPPYPNNIDYTEVYKLENWLLGFIENGRDFGERRHETVYSHPSVLRPDPLPSVDLDSAENAVVGAVIAPVVESIPDDRYLQARTRMVRGYAVDMFLVLKGAAARLAPTGRAVYVVGNSLHGRAPAEFVIAADLLMAEFARSVGLEVDRVAVARMPTRRANASPFLRESVVFLRPNVTASSR